MLAATALLGSAAVASGPGAASVSKFSRAVEVISSAMRGDSRSSIPIITSDGRRATPATLVHYVNACELSRLEERGSVLSASLLCRVQKLAGVEVRGGANLLQDRPMQFVFAERNVLVRVVLGDRDPLASRVNVLPRRPN
jgi:hypothetical protein